ncbi:PP2C family protein-serine/threonine phosphatase [Hahella ganghwensis]|uniref:PP2C family protein-serine/threonine phosphatase n=1 Tax=Hahella ganghwensis TaxID=286420 RepID=UPI00037267CF|nr:protein phosphatase 2C domain-containing protein [Hahella ganghwensis]
MNSIECSVAQINGARSYQEDCYQVVADLPSGEGRRGHLYVLCDGMGGHADGAVASQLICDHFVASFRAHSIEIRERLATAVNEANLALAEYIAQRPDKKSMGSTLVAVWLEENQIWWVSIGDSPLWLIRKGQLTRLNEDHSMAPVFQRMVDLGQMSQASADSDIKRHVLRSAVNGEDIRLVDLVEKPLELVPGDLLMLASDGVESLSDECIRDLLISSPSDSCQRILNELMQQIEMMNFEEQDNASAILIRVSAPAWNTLSPYGTGHRQLKEVPQQRSSASSAGWKLPGPNGLWYGLGIVVLLVLIAIVTGVFSD